MTIADHQIFSPPAMFDGEARLVRISPNGSALAFASNEPERTRIYRTQLDAGRQNLSVIEFAARAFDLAWSPDGSHLAYLLGPLGDDIPCWLGIADANHREVTKLDATAFAWGPKGIVALASSGRTVWQLDMATQTQRTLCEVLHVGTGAIPPRVTVSPCGRRAALFLRRAHEGISEVWTVTLDRSPKLELATEIPTSDAHVLPFFSPDGSDLALFVAPPNEADEEEVSVVLLPRKGQKGGILFTSRRASELVSPAWSPDGKSIAALVDGMLAVLDLREGRVDPLGDPGAIIGTPQYLSAETLLVDGGSVAHALALAS